MNTLEQDLTLFVDSYHANLTPEQVAKRRNFGKEQKNLYKIGGFNIHIKDLDEKMKVMFTHLTLLLKNCIRVVKS